MSGCCGGGHQNHNHGSGGHGSHGKSGKGRINGIIWIVLIGGLVYYFLR